MTTCTPRRIPVSSLYYTSLWRLILLGVLLHALFGCVRVGSVTDIETDGSFIKTVRLVSPSETSVPGEAKIVLRDLLALEGDGWQVSLEEDGDEEVLTAMKRFAAGETAEFRLKDGGKDMTRSRTVVSGDSVEEVWEWVGEPVTKEMEEMGGPILEKIQEELPGLSASAQQEIADRVIRAMWRELYGPNDPLALMFMNEERFIRQAQIRLFRAFVLALEAAGVEKPEDAARRMTKSLVDEEFGGQQDGPSYDDEDENEEDEGGNRPTFVVNVTVRAVGRGLTSDTGEVNPVEETVEWTFLPQVCALEPLRLRATFR